MGKMTARGGRHSATARDGGRHGRSSEAGHAHQAGSGVHHHVSRDADDARYNHPQATALMCCLVFDTLRAELGQLNTGGIDDEDRYAGISDDVSCGVFVTYNKSSLSSFSSSSRLSLRGCIGTLSPGPLRRTLCTYAVTAALRDRRFQPITASELPQLQVGVSLLVDFEVIENDLHAWEIGVHGLVLDFTIGSQSYSATFLPEVALEQQWSRIETITHLVRKAGFQGTISQSFLDNVRLTRYRSSKYSIDYHEYSRLSTTAAAEAEPAVVDPVRS